MISTKKIINFSIIFSITFFLCIEKIRLSWEISTLYNNNEILKVEYTFGFIKINNNELRINLHHSSLPYGG